MWDAFQSIDHGAGILYNHRDYCGIGLIRDSSGVALVRVQDGDPCGPPLQRWTSAPDFVDYWSRQHDYGLSGADFDHPELLASNDFELNNQRLTQRRIHDWLDSRARATSECHG